MSIGDTVVQVAQHPATQLTAAVVAGTLLQKVFNVLGAFASLFAKKPDVLPDVLAVLKDLQNKQNVMPDILKLLQDLKDNGSAGAKVNG